MFSNIVTNIKILLLKNLCFILPNNKTLFFMKKRQTIFLLIALSISILINNSKSFAHEGGHYQKGDVLDSWTLLNGDVVKGNFAMSKDNNIVLEQSDGKSIVISIQSLSIQSQEIAHRKIKKYEQLNSLLNPTLQNAYKNSLPWDIFYLIIAILIGIFIFAFVAKQIAEHHQRNSLQHLNAKLFVVSLSSILFVIACKKSAEIATVGTIPKTTTSFIDSAFSPYKPSVATSWDNNYFYVASNGFPNHNMMIGITSWQQQVPIPQFYTGTNKWTIPLQPVYAAVPLSTKTNFMKGAVAIAANGIPIFNALNNRGEDSYLIGELDNWGGHCGKADDYHYHSAPLHLSTTSGSKPIAFALDGFAVYGASEPNGTTMQTLDTCHGHIGSNGVYHYHGTSNYPYVIGAMKGKVVTDPSTPAPENQILPQAFASPLRPATNPLNGATITNFVSTGSNAYSLTYNIGAQNGYVNYSWNSANLYTFTLINVLGVSSTTTYQR